MARSERRVASALDPTFTTSSDADAETRSTVRLLARSGCREDDDLADAVAYGLSVPASGHGIDSVELLFATVTTEGLELATIEAA